MKNILVLSTFDSTIPGHALYLYQLWKELGQNVFYLPLIRQFSDYEHFFIDAKGRYSFKRILFAISLRLSKILIKKMHKEKCVFNLFLRGRRAKEILDKTPFVPDIIVICWGDGYITPKTIRELYDYTRATIIIPMIDAHILGGGCHYPCGCEQYLTGCHHCPALRLRFFARKEYSNKMKYLYNVPIVIGGTKWDLQRAGKTPFLSGKETIESIDYFVMPFVVEKSEARLKFGISSDHFVIMFGAANVYDKRKGIDYLLSALKIISDRIVPDRPITLLCLGEFNNPLEIDGFTVVSPGYLKYEDMITAFYAADIFVSPSVDDSGPYMVNYSIACGRPVVTFPVGIALTHVKNRKIGYLAKWKDPQDMANGILYYYEQDGEYMHECSEECTKLMENYQKTVTPFYMQVIER